MYLFKRDYEITIDTESASYVVKPDLQVTFQCNKSTSYTGLNNCNINIYNLSPAKREALKKDADEQDKKISVSLKAGYAGAISQLFKGTVYTAGSVRSGNDYITKLECIDGGFAYQNSYTSTCITKRKEAIEKLLEDMNGITLGQIPEIEDFQRPLSLVGNPFQLLKQLLNNDATYFIDDEKLYILKDTETTDLETVSVTPESGLLSVHDKKNNTVSINTLLNPLIKIGSAINLQTKYSDSLNGSYRVDTIEYKGDYAGQDWMQIFECLRI